MGYSLSWLAVKGKSPQAVRDELGFRVTGEHEAMPESDLTAAELPNGWYLMVAHRSEQVVPDGVLKQLSAGCEDVTCFVEEHVMFSSATGLEGRPGDAVGQGTMRRSSVTISRRRVSWLRCSVRF